MPSSIKRSKARRRNQYGSAIAEMGSSLVVFICFIFVPLIDIAFVPARYLLVNTYLEKVTHRMALSDNRTKAIQYFNSGSWKGQVETLGVKLQNAAVNLIVYDPADGKSISLQGTSPVPSEWLPDNVKPGHARVYELELAADIDVPPLFSSKVGLPGFNKPIRFPFRARHQWENLSPDPYNSGDPTDPKRYYINQ